MADENFELDPQARDILVKAVQNVCESQCNVSFSKDPEFVELDIIEYNSIMRVSALEKFNGPCYITIVTIYSDEGKRDRKDACGSIIMYLNESIAGSVLKPLIKEQGVDADDPEVIGGNFKTLTQEVANQFKSTLAPIGLGGVVFGEPEFFVSVVPSGAEFTYTEHRYHEVHFFIGKEKNLVVDLTITTT